LLKRLNKLLHAIVKRGLRAPFLKKNIGKSEISKARKNDSKEKEELNKDGPTKYKQFNGEKKTAEFIRTIQSHTDVKSASKNREIK